MQSVGDKATDLVSERVDLAVRITNTLDPAMITRPLARCRSMLVASPEYLKRHGAPNSLEDLRRHRCIAHASVIGKQYRFGGRGEAIEIPVRSSFHTNETAVLRRPAGAAADVGSTFIAGAATTHDIGTSLTERMARGWTHS